MSWSWRSKESYGDKSANFEGGEAEEPAADEGAKTPKKKKTSIWDDGKTSWWDEYESTSSAGRGSSSVRRDDSYRAYSYDDAFDDSDARWYRRNSFKYDSYRDYSPSRLFRSSFSSIGFGTSYYSSSSGDSELKNKAIRALRSLTRNANTVADKSAKISYDVKFSGGADGNGTSEELTGKTGKQQRQVIYVSPDDLADAKTEDDTDAVIDALTGFVLLRVQLSQSVNKEVIDAVNTTAMRAVPTKLASLLTNHTITKEIARTFSAECTDDYAAGMLTKSMLTRLARRGVIKDWGGFAPYFVRHAKKFTEMREKLTPKPDEGLSVALLAAQLSYNFISDDNPIELDKGVEEIVNRHLGAELAAEEILPACRALVAELREHLAKTNSEMPPGQLEKALQDILESCCADNEAADERKAAQAFGEHLDKLADLFENVFEAAVDCDSRDIRGKRNSLINAADRKVNEIKAATKLAESLQAHATAINGEVKHADDLTKTGGNGATRLFNQIRYMQSTVDSHLAHYGGRLSKLCEEHSIDLSSLTSPRNAVPLPEDSIRLRAMAEEYAAKIEATAKQVEAAAKAAVKEYKKQTSELLEFAKETLARQAEAVDKLRPQMEALRDEAKELAAHAPRANDTLTAVESLRNLLNEVSNTNKNHQESADAAHKKLSAARGPASMQRADSAGRAAADAGRVGLEHLICKMNGSMGGRPMNNFASQGRYWHQEAVADYESVPEGDYTIDPKWREKAKQEFANGEAAGQLDFTTALIRQTHETLLNALLQQLKKRPRKSADDSKSAEAEESGALPDFDELTVEQQTTLQNAAALVGLGAYQLFDLLKKLEQMKTTPQHNAMAEKLGAELKEKLIEPAAAMSPIDEKLFGEQVENSVKGLLGHSLDNVHDEASRNVEEEFVAYLSHNDARPSVKVTKQQMSIASSRRTALDIKKRNRGAIDRIRDALNFQSNKRVGEVHGLTSGDLDEGNLHKLRYDSEHIWSQKTITRLPDVAVGILVDQSGSMSGPKIAQAQEMCVVLAEAIKQIKGVHLHIYGHTANRGEADLLLFEHYSSYGDAQNADLGRLGGICAMSNNYDGYAIKETAKRLALDPAKRKYLFVLADGLPSGHGYGGPEAEKHVKSVCAYVRNKLKISTYAFGVGVISPNAQNSFKTQYGENNVVFIAQVRQALPKIVRFLRNVLQKERTLVDVSAD